MGNSENWKKEKMKKEITFEDFLRIDIRVGTIIEVCDFKKARKPAYQLKIDFGAEIGIIKSSAQITKRYAKEDLFNKQIVAVVNFPKKQIGEFMSECLVLGSVGESNDIVLLSPHFKVENGLRIRNHHMKAKRNNTHDNTWYDKLLFNPVIILGAGMSPSEWDLWFALTSRERTNASHPQIFQSSFE